MWEDKRPLGREIPVFSVSKAGRILVVGDVMLDRYVHGQVARISPEAPVPVLRWTRNESVAGGAANVAANIASLGGHVRLASVVGDDVGAAELEAVLRAWGDHLQIDITVQRARLTTLKTRFITNGQQLLRLDQEDISAIAPETADRLFDTILKALPTTDIVVLSDYRKGVLTHYLAAKVIDLCRAAEVPVIVDPKQADWTAYRGASVITPNRAELSDVTGMPCDGDEDAAAAALFASERYDTAVLLTRSERGMVLVEKGEAAVYIPTQAREVSDVSGAGDTVVGVLALSMASGLALLQAMRIANVAAGLVVAKRGTATVTRGELDRALRGVGPQHAGVMSLVEVSRLRAMWREQGLRVGFTNGCFDIIHPGHIGLLEQAAAHCDRLIVAINSDASVQRLKGPTRPVQNGNARAKVLGAMHVVDAVVVFDEDTPLELIATLQPDLLVKGADYREDQVVGADIVKAGGGRVLLATLEEGHSTTSIVTRSASGNVTPTQGVTRIDLGHEEGRGSSETIFGIGAGWQRE